MSMDELDAAWHTFLQIYMTHACARKNTANATMRTTTDTTTKNALRQQA
jgi:hypothetical protein